MEVIRAILQKEESKEESGFGKYEDQVEIYQVTLMLDAGLVEGEILQGAGKPIFAIIYRLTWNGHEFLDSVRDPSIWQKAKDKVLKPGASWTFGILMEFAKAEALRRLGMLTP